MPVNKGTVAASFLRNPRYEAFSALYKNIDKLLQLTNDFLKQTKVCLVQIINYINFKHYGDYNNCSPPLSH